MAFFIMEYRVKGYAISDAFRRDPTWGKKTFFVSAKDAGTDDIEIIRSMAAARESTPDGYEFHSVRDRDAVPAPT